MAILWTFPLRSPCSDGFWREIDQVHSRLELEVGFTWQHALEILWENQWVDNPPDASSASQSLAEASAVLVGVRNQSVTKQTGSKVAYAHEGPRTAVCTQISCP